MIGLAYRWFLMTMVLLLTMARCYAGSVETTSKSNTGKLDVASTIIVADEKFQNQVDYWNSINNLSVKNSVSLRLIDTKFIQALAGTTFTVVVEVKQFNTFGTSPTTTTTKTLTVGYNQTPGATYNAIQSYLFEGAFRVEVKVLSITSSTYPSVAAMPDVLQLWADITVDRIYPFNASDPISFFAPYSIGNDRQLPLNWTFTKGSQEFDVEWTTVDAGSEFSTTINNMLNDVAVSTDDLNKIFRNNATRVVIQGNSYRLSAMYNDDFMLVRIRHAAYDANGVRTTGNWEYKHALNAGAALKYNCWALTWNEQNLNWQFSASFAEDGKKKEVISYFDGTLRNRQTVTINNNDNVGVIQENVYDEFGRPAASILPAPFTESGVTVPYLHYKGNFNINSSDKPYSIADITRVSADACEALPAPLKITSGAANYYSASNPFKSLPNSNNYNKYIPDADGYPLSVTQYTKDNTGRIKLQGGVGATFQPGTGATSKTTKYYYGKPSQRELDQMFGTDVGYADHYSKNMVIDPNGQVSLSYLNASGKTIATALSGPVPVNVDALPSVALADASAVTERIFKPEQFVFNSTSLKVTATTSYIATTPDQNVKLQYNIQQIITHYPNPDINICSNCYYSLTITITDDCGNKITLPGLSQPIKIGNETTLLTASPNASSQFENVNFPRVGEYSIKFELAYDANVIDNYVNNFELQGLQKGYLKQKFDHIKQAFLDKMDASGCYSDCRTCQTQLANESEFKAVALNEFLTLGVKNQNSESNDNINIWINNLYNTLKTKCNDMQASCVYADCDTYRKPMLADLSPGGQYGLFNSTNTVDASETNTNLLAKYFGAVFHPATKPAEVDDDHVLLPDGTSRWIYSNDFNITNMLDNWRPEWSSMFLKYHPEYCKLKYCEYTSNYTNWEARVKEVVHGEADFSLIPGAPPGMTYTENAYNLLSAIDPFFASGAYGNQYKTAIENDLLYYTTNVLKINNRPALNLYQYIKYLLYCKDADNNSNNYWPTCNPSCRVKDREWQMFSNLYFELKQKYYVQGRNSYISSDPTCSCVRIIGKPYTFNPDPTNDVCPQIADFKLDVAKDIDESDYDVTAVKLFYLKGAVPKKVTIQFSYIESGVTKYTNMVIPFGKANGKIYLPYSVAESSVQIISITCDASQTNTTCPEENYYTEKRAIFPEYVDQGSVSLTEATANAVKASSLTQLKALISDNCAYSAAEWIAKLAPGLHAKYPDGTTYNNIVSLLTAKFIAVCSAGGDENHLMGVSLLPSANTAGDIGFGQIISQNVFASGGLTADINPWLINSPYPYNTSRRSQSIAVSQTSADVCTRLTALKNEFIATLGGSAYTLSGFSTYLKTKYGTQVMNITDTELDDLLSSCSCSYLLKNDIELPVFLDNNGCITRAQYNAALADMNAAFSISASALMAHANYPVILTNYMNQKWGFNLNYSDYQAYTSNGMLCNDVTSAEAPVDKYACIKNELQSALYTGLYAYNKYIEDERSKFRADYISQCSLAQNTADLTTKAPKYHYTLYYYDQAENLIRTVPPEGVKLLANDQLPLVEQGRLSDNTTVCTDDPIMCNGTPVTYSTDKTAAFNQVSTALTAGGARAFEFWFYNSSNTSDYQMVQATPDRKYLVQVSVNNGVVGFDLYPMVESGDHMSVSLVPTSYHYRGAFSGNSPGPWLHVVVQASGIATGGFPQMYLNGAALSVSASTAGMSPGWSIQATSTGIIYPDNIATLKHMRVYPRLMTAGEITTNANDNCFRPSNACDGMLWYRFNIPAPGGATTIAANSSVETSGTGLFPSHVLATTYAYNSTNQVLQQKSPDGGINRFWYDDLSRLVASQNDKQGPNNKYSYTEYDYLGRINAVGEKQMANANLSDPGYISKAVRDAFISATAGNAQITKTYYDGVAPTVSGNTDGIASVTGQENLRKRVATTTYQDSQAGPVLQATYYNYDLSGNVKTLWQQVNGLTQANNLASLKRIDYEYDLISGKVNFVAYQHDGASPRPDQFYYQYSYDAENRLTSAWSGTAALVEPFGGSTLLPYSQRLDASYWYYLHGPLARMELGDQYTKVQGLDYAYTLQGWLKGVNGTALNPTAEVGNDGTDATNFVPRDAFAFSLGYYNGDYKPIGTGSAFALKYTPAAGDEAGHNLYNGNISNTTVAISKINGDATAGYSYKYDQLNRLTKTRMHSGISGTTWGATSAINDYKENAAYDANGNITTYSRYSNTTVNPAGGLMDELTYRYNKVDGNLTNNRLLYIDDIANNGSANDLRDQNPGNYQYDAIGNLTADAQAGVNSIDWTVYGKIKAIDNATGSDIAYAYDAGGNRVRKTVGTLNTYYVRDAQGNTLGIYDDAGSTVNWREQQLYGSSRLGLWQPDVNLATAGAAQSQWEKTGLKRYELNNHLGNVLATISDRRLQHAINENQAFDYYMPDVITAQDYYPFGMVQPGRTYANGSNKYRYGFNGKENDNEVKGIGNQVDFGARAYDPRIGRWFSPDKVSKPSYSSYQFSKDSPTNYVDPDGNDEIHFYYYTQQNLDKNGKAYTSISVSSQIIENGRQDHTFFVHPQLGKAVQIQPFEAGSNIANQHSFSAARNDLAMASVTKYLFGMAQVHTDDYEYLGKLLLADPSVAKHYANNAAWSRAFSGAELQVSSANFGRKVLNTSETVYGIIDGYNLVRGGVSTVIGAISKSKGLASGSIYSVAYEMKLSTNLYPGGGYYSHFKAANESLSATMASDATFAKSMSDLGISVPRSSNGAFKGSSPTNWVWHHDVGEGIMQLVPSSQHTAGSAFWNTLHPNGVGGMFLWGK